MSLSTFETLQELQWERSLKQLASDQVRSDEARFLGGWFIQMRNVLLVLMLSLSAPLICVAQTPTTPTLVLAAGKTGISSNEDGCASNFKFQMEASGWPRAVTAG